MADVTRRDDLPRLLAGLVPALGWTLLWAFLVRGEMEAMAFFFFALVLTLGPTLVQARGRPRLPTPEVAGIVLVLLGTFAIAFAHVARVRGFDLPLMHAETLPPLLWWLASALLLGGLLLLFRAAFTPQGPVCAVCGAPWSATTCPGCGAPLAGPPSVTP